MKKQCTQCKKEKENSEFPKDKRTKSGLYSACKSCHYEYIKSWRREYHKNWYRKNKKRYDENTKKWIDENREYFKELRRDYMKNVWLKNPQNRLDANIRRFVWQSLKGKKAGQKWKELVGYTIEDLMKHLESQFDDKMTWQNYGEWHVDHIIPRSHFKYETAEDPEFKKCWALENLQPMWAIENFKKGNKTFNK
jgi:hypothetical protein